MRIIILFDYPVCFHQTVVSIVYKESGIQDIILASALFMKFTGALTAKLQIFISCYYRFFHSNHRCFSTLWFGKRVQESVPAFVFALLPVARLYARSNSCFDLS